MKVKYRVKTHEDFQKVIRANKKVSNLSYVIFYKKNEYGYARIGISTSKKLGDAVTRNRIRRQVRAMCQDVIDYNKSIDYCIVVRNGYLQREFNVNKAELQIAILKI